MLSAIRGNRGEQSPAVTFRQPLGRTTRDGLLPSTPWTTIASAPACFAACASASVVAHANQAMPRSLHLATNGSGKTP